MKAKRFNFFLEEEIKDKIKEVASKEGLTSSAWIRQLIIKTLKERKEL